MDGPLTVSVREVRVLTGHTQRLHQGVRWTQGRNGELLLGTASQDGSIRIWDGRSGMLLHVLRVQSGPVYSLDWTTDRDGRLLLATCGRSGNVNVWDGDSGALLRTLIGHSDWAVAVRWVPDGGLKLVSGAMDKSVRVWDAETGESLGEHTYEAEVHSLNFGRDLDGHLVLAIGMAGGAVEIRRDLDWNEPSRRLDTVTPRYPGPLDVVAFIDWLIPPDGRQLLAVAGYGSSRVTLWDNVTGELVRTIGEHTGGATGVAWVTLPGGRPLLASCGNDHKVRIWDVNAGLCAAELDLSEKVGTVGWASPDENSVLLAAGCDDGKVSVHEVRWESPRTTEVPGLTAVPSEPRLGGGRILAVGWTGDFGRRVPRYTWADGASYAAIERTRRDDPWVVIGYGDRVEVRHNDLIQDFTARDVRSVACLETPHGTVVVAAGTEHSGVLVWQPVAGRSPQGYELPYRGFASAVVFGMHREGKLLLAAGGPAPSSWVSVWDIQFPSRDPLPSLAAQFGVNALAFTPDGTWLAGGGWGGVQVWDVNSTDAVVTIPFNGYVRALAWAELPDGRRVLAAGLDVGTVVLWDIPSATELLRLQTGCGDLSSVDIVTDSTAFLLVVVGGTEGSRSYTLHDDPSAPAPAPERRPDRHGPAATASLPGLFALGRSGMWPPLGLLEDLVTLTGAVGAGPGAGLHDGRLTALREHPGVRRLGELGWPAPARVALAGLLLAETECGEQWTPPEGSGPAQWRAALAAASRQAVAAPAASVPASVPAPVPELTAAADRVVDGTVAMLTLLGPEAATADPVTVLRLAGRGDRLLGFGADRLRSLSAAAAALEQSAAAARAGVARFTPGAVGVSRRGPFDQLLRTQLALPADLLTLRRVTGQLLYRQHTTVVPPRLRPVTVVLDTTPPTFGPVEQLLRLVAHLMTTALWGQGERPLLVTATRPGYALELAGPVQLAELWTSRTLRDPGEVLAEALDTARTTSHPVVLLTHQHAPLPATTTGLRLLTTCHPGEEAVVPASGAGRHHLPSDPPLELLVSTVRALLTAGEAR
jgi:WD40 repeat protein